MYSKAHDGEKRSEQDAAFLSAIGNSKRLQLLSMISQREWSVGDLAIAVDLSQSALSQHLARLRSMSMVETRRVNQTIFYSCKLESVRLILEALAIIAASRDTRIATRWA